MTSDGFSLYSEYSYKPNDDRSKKVTAELRLESIEGKQLSERILFDRINVSDPKLSPERADRCVHNTYSDPVRLVDMDTVRKKCCFDNIVEYYLAEGIFYVTETKYRGFVINKDPNNRYSAYVIFSSGGSKWFVQQLYELDHKLNSFKED